VVALLLASATLWLVIDMRASMREQLEAWRATAESERSAAEQRVGAAVGEAVDRAASDHAAVQAEVEAQLAAVNAQLDSVTAERDGAVADLAAAGGETEALRARVTELEAAQVQLESDLTAAKDERLKLIGESARLLEQVLDRDRKLDVLNRSIGELHDQGVASHASSVVTSTRGEGLAARASEALRRGGAAQSSILQARLGQDGALHDVLARVTEDDQPPRVLSAERAVLVTALGHASLRLEGVSATDDAGAAPPDIVDIDLPSYDPAPWTALGLVVPGPFRAASDVTAALNGLLQRFGWQLEALGGVDGETLLGLELSQVEAGGRVLRTLRAARGSLAAGPELTLWEGAVTTNGDERPFFGGVFRLPLPGLDAAAWSAALVPEVP
jgi:hypothetical protein